jgi:hypothetical protein
MLDEDRTRSGKQELAVGLAVSLSVLEANGRQTQTRSGVGLVDSQDTTAGGGDGVLYRHSPHIVAKLL